MQILAEIAHDLGPKNVPTRRAELYREILGQDNALAIWASADDNGSDFISHHIEQVCADLKIRAVFSLPGKPRGRGRIERFFRTVNQRCLSILPGYAPAAGRFGKSAPRVPKLSLSELDEALKRFFIEDYNRQPHSTTGIAPQERWHGDGFLPRMPASLKQLDLLLLTVVQPRRVQQDGIRFQRFRYIDPVLAAYVGEWVTIRYDPRDMAEIRVYHRDEFVCRAVCQELAGKTVSLREIIGARRRRARELRQVIKERHALYGQTFSISNVQHQMPKIRPVESQPEAATPSKSSLKHYECD